MTALVHGPLAPLFDDPRVTEILVNGPDAVYAEVGGRLQRADVAFRDAVELRQTVVRLVGLCGRRIDDATPLVDARLPDGSRLNAVLPPLAVDGPLLTIRRFGVRRLTIDDLLQLGSMLPAQAADAARGRRRAPQRGHLGRHLVGQDDAARGDRRADRPGRAHRVGRGRGRAGAADSARRPARGPAGERRGPRRDRRAGAGAQRAAHASRPARRGRGARRRGTRPAARAEHRPRRLARHGARERTGRRAPPARDDGADGRRRPAARRDPREHRHRRPRRRARRSPGPTAGASCPRSPPSSRPATAGASPGPTPSASARPSGREPRVRAIPDRRRGRPSVRRPPPVRGAARRPAARTPPGRSRAPTPPACRSAPRAGERPTASTIRPRRSCGRPGSRPSGAACRPTPCIALADAPGGGLIRGAIAVNAELGGDLVRALEALAEGLDDRERLRGEIAVATAQARFASRVVPAVPLLALGLLGALSPAAVCRC